MKLIELNELAACLEDGLNSAQEFGNVVNDNESTLCPP